MAKWYGFLLSLEIAVSVAVVMIFRLIESRFTAGMVAGSTFVLLGFVIVGTGLLGKIKWKSVTFVLGCVHLGLIAIPMIVARWLNSGVEFSQIQVMGLPGPVFHQLSTRLYLFLMVATFVEGTLAWRSKTRSN